MMSYSIVCSSTTTVCSENGTFNMIRVMAFSVIGLIMRHQRLTNQIVDYTANKCMYRYNDDDDVQLLTITLIIYITKWLNITDYNVTLLTSMYVHTHTHTHIHTHTRTHTHPHTHIYTHTYTLPVMVGI